MPSAEQIQRYLTGVWRMATGRPDGLGLLDLTVDGFWNSFFAIVVALPALVVSWVSTANALGGDDFGSRLSVVVRLGVTDVMSWLLPIALLAAVARPLGIVHRFAPYVVATNWASALFVWMMLPPTLVDLFWPAAGEATSLVLLLVFLATLVLAWRVTNVALGMGAVVASLVFGGMFAASLGVLLSLQSVFGLSPGP